MKANNPSKTARLQERQSYINFYRKEVLKYHEISFSQFIKKPQERRLFLALQVIPATAKVVSIAFKIPIESQCRRKRKLEDKGLLQVSKKRSICPITKHYANLLTTNKELFNSKYFSL
ncbi:hypothetical protein FFWV33_16105 [Flavobacterium faecale]|uniref:Uncharacterized protein n=1 Tax=Flavobacterium faecale TaxID=1355330 RepID=A0A2S1LH19_9FLAO|nr:hypothetical protein [Flavobacterium faecale]AWG22941.1 hypothetical protein FFWV33_16105 [Flavobacterium faecale]